MQMLRLRVILCTEILATLSGLFLAAYLYNQGGLSPRLALGSALCFVLLITGSVLLYGSVYRARENADGVVCFDPKSLIGSQCFGKTKLCTIHFEVAVLIVLIGFVVVLTVVALWVLYAGIGSVLENPVQSVFSSLSDLPSVVLGLVLMLVFGIVLEKSKAARVMYGALFATVLALVTLFVLGGLTGILVGEPIDALVTAIVDEEQLEIWSHVVLGFPAVAIIFFVMLVIKKEQWLRTQRWLRPFWRLKDNTCIEMRACTDDE